jgi:hypothetical protein
MPEPAVVIPNPRIPAAIGTLNIAFGTLLLLGGLAVVAWSLAYPQLAQYMISPVAEEQKAKRAAEIQAQVASTKARLAKETDPVVLKALEQQLEMLDEDRADNESDGDEYGSDRVRDTRVISAFWIEQVLGLVLNVLLVVSGVGLIALRRWGHRLALQVAGLKLVKVVVFMLLGVFLTIPLQAVKTRQSWERWQARNGSASLGTSSEAAEMAQAVAVSTTLATVGYGVAGLIYPALALWLLSKRSVRAALLPASNAAEHPPPPPGERPAGVS